MSKGEGAHDDGKVLEGELILPADEKKIDDIVARLNEFGRQASFLFMLKVGELIVNELFEGNLDEWAKRRETDVNFTRLSKRLEGEERGLDPSTLSRSVGVYELYHRVGEDIVTSQYLKANHYVAVLGLEVKTAEKLLRTADKREWTVAELRAEAGKLRDRSKAGRKPDLPFQKTIRQFGRVLADSDERFAGLDRLDKLKPKAADELFDTLSKMEERISSLKQAIGPRTSKQSPSP